MNDNKKKVLFGAAMLACLLIVFAALFFLNRLSSTADKDLQVTDQTTFSIPTAQIVTEITPTPILVGLPVDGWKFEGFNGEKTRENGFVYSWGIFINDNGTKIKAMCSSPNSPAPNVGDYYYWDKRTNILAPVVNNETNNIQTFWYPTVIQ